ncbi:MAG: hypothetical protein RR954_08705 [Christensenellaceae bacterium]
MKHFIGIDPGKSGALAVIDNSLQLIELVDYSDKIYETLSCYDTATTYCAIEKVHSMPKQGVVSVFSFGENFGFLKGCLAALGFDFCEVTPQRWQKLELPAKLTPTDKPSLAVARSLYPDAPLSRKKDNGRSDAIMIARWAALTIGL